MTETLSYVVITPARNEAEFIELTLKSVAAQTIPPLKWVIVSDGSTDGTDEIVSRYAAQNPWIELLRMPERQERDFAGKVMAFNAGYARVRDLHYDVIASLDADISLPARDYFEFLLAKLADDPALGLVGTPFEDNSIAYDYRFVSIEHVSGACQVFRRQCFEQIGGYVPVKGGGIDQIAVVSARMKGWKTRTFTEKKSVHSREMGTAQHSAWKARLYQGAKDYAFGYHPLWEIFRTAYQMTKRPFVLGGVLLAVGYLWALIRRTPRPISAEMVAFQRSEQMRRLKNLFFRQESRWQPTASMAERPHGASDRTSI
jgi:glycosyltransferase involved in cell wall biosynthesis